MVRKEEANTVTRQKNRADSTSSLTTGAERIQSRGGDVLIQRQQERGGETEWGGEM